MSKGKGADKMGKLLKLLGIKRECRVSSACTKKRSYILVVRDESGKEKRRQIIKHTPIELQVMLKEKPACYEVYTTMSGCKLG